MSEPKYATVVKTIQQRIQEGYYVPAQRLPSEYTLAEEFGVTRMTIRKAIGVLINQHLLVKKPGYGTYVVEQSQDKIASGQNGLQGFTEVAQSYGKTSHTEVLAYEPLITPSPAILAKLATPGRPNGQYDRLVRRRFWDDDPMTIEEVVLCHEYVAGKQAKDFEGSLFAILEQQVDIAYAHQEIEATAADERLAALLDQKLNAPLLVSHTVTFTSDGKPILYDQSYYRSDKYSFKSTLMRRP